jgi:hypothetical protein
MKGIRFWILTTGSVFVCLLYVEQIYLSRAIYQQRQVLIDSQQIVSYGQSYESSWKQLAARVYLASRQDPALADVLKRNKIAVQANKPASSDVPTPQPAPTSVKPPTTLPSKTPVGP